MPAPEGIAGQFIGALFASQYYVVVFALQVIGGALLLSGQFIPLALTLLGPVIGQYRSLSFLYGAQRFTLAIVVLVLWLTVFLGVRKAFDGIFVKRV